METIYVDTSVFGGKFDIERIHGYNAVNLKNGLKTLEIRNPREAFDYEDNN